MSLFGGPMIPDSGGPMMPVRSLSTSYVGHVATGCRVPQSLNAPTAAQMMSRSRHRMAASTPTIRIGIPHWFIANTNSSAIEETVAAGAALFTGSLEYPAGTFTQLTWDGQIEPFLVPIGTFFSDPVTAPPQGAFFYIRIWRDTTVVGGGATLPCMKWPNGVDTANGEACTYGATGIADQTMGGTITNTTNGVMFSPIAIIGTTNQPSIGVVGDSRAFGLGDTFTGTSGGIGEIERAVNSNYAVMNLGVSGDQGNSFLFSNALRFSALRFCSHLICQYGINDIVTGGDSLATVQNALKNVWSYWRDPTKVFQTTLPPYTTSTDSWATLVNQTPNAAESVRVAVNDWIRTIPSGLHGFFEVANQVENSQDGGKWQVNGSAFFYTPDGVHENSTSNIAIANSGCFQLGAFTLP